MSRWFRLYDELLDDPKVQRLSGDDFKAWINILCLASRHDGSIPPVDDIAFALRADLKKASAIVARLVSADLLVQIGDRYMPHGWNERQFKSDVSTNRVKAFRDRKKAASSNGDETFHATPPDTDTDTDTDTEVPLAKANGANLDPDKAFWDASKAYLGPKRASLIGKWVKVHGREATASAIAAAQVERAVDPVSFIEGRWRQQARQFEEGPLV